MQSLLEIHRGKTGKISDKWGSYLSAYERLFAPFRGETVAVLEIGVQFGGSLETWAAYFSNARVIAGVDIDPICQKLKFADPRIRFVSGNVNDPAVFDQLATIGGRYDIIIDDGSHLSTDVIQSFLAYFTLLAPGGLYVIEDTHALYWARYGGGLARPDGALELFRRLTDLVNVEFWEDGVTIPDYLKAFFHDGRLPSVIRDGWIDSIEFRNSLIVLKKALRPGHDKLGERLTSGFERPDRDL